MWWLFRNLRNLGRDTEGAAALIFTLAVLIVLGVAAFSVDAARFFAVKSRLSIATEMAAVAAAKNLNFLSESELNTLASETVAATFRQMKLLSFSGAVAASPTVSLAINTTTGNVTVTVDALVPTTMLSFVGFLDDVSLRETVTTRQVMPDAELVMILDSSAEMGTLGKLADLTATAQNFMTLFGSFAFENSGLQFGLVPVGNTLANVAPHSDWVVDGAWPINIPPNVPGTTAWGGDLAEQRWCVDVRTGAAGVTDLTPGTEKFPLILEVSSELDPVTGIPHFSVTTTADCRPDRIMPISNSSAGISAALATLSGHGTTSLGRGMAWGERILSPLWQSLWEIGSTSPVAYNDPITGKIIVLTVGTGNADPGVENILLGDVCSRLKSNGVTIYVVDYLAPTATSTLLSACATTVGHYFRVETASELSDAFFTIAKFITVVRLNG